NLILTNLVEGITTNWLFVSDLDADRLNDALMSPATNFVMYLDMTAPTQATGFAVSLGPDETSEIQVDWNPLDDGGNSALSPWETYRIYYREGAGTPTTNDLYISRHNGPLSLATNITSGTIVSNFEFETEYSLALAGVDAAGNVGPLSSYQSVTMGSFAVTQGVVGVTNVAEQGTRLSWIGTTNRIYDVLYVDSRSFENTLSNQWSLLDKVTNVVLVDTGAPGRIPPPELTYTMRFYRVAREDTWSTNLQTRLGSREVYVTKAVELNPGENWQSLFFEPDTNTLA
ncbi:MAG: hypothetical protein KDL10_07320, partial [Kiritimatiellae bacterium]|nr:hypothetical protein [Kiritimatiellia bacterium]